MNHGNHRATKEKKSRKRLLGVPITIWMWSALVGTALAVWAVLFSFGGTVTSGAFDVYTATGTSAVATGGTCTAALNAGQVDVTWSGMTPGDTCTVTQKFAGNAANDSDAVLQSFTLNHDGANATDLTGIAGASCGATIVGAAELDVDITLELGDTSSSGTAYAIDDLTSGYEWVPAGAYVPGNCA